MTGHQGQGKLKKKQTVKPKDEEACWTHPICSQCGTVLMQWSKNGQTSTKKFTCDDHY